MKKYLFIILILVCSINTLYAQQQDYRTVIGEYTFVNVIINHKSGYSNMVQAVSKDFDLETLNKDNLNSFLESLFKNSFLMASLYYERRSFIKEYNVGQTETDAIKFSYDFWEMQEALSEDYKLKLRSGEKIIIQLFNIKGLFWVVKKDNRQVINTDTSRINIFELPYIQDCYIPAVISEYSKYKGSITD